MRAPGIADEHRACTTTLQLRPAAAAANCAHCRAAAAACRRLPAHRPPPRCLAACPHSFRPSADDAASQADELCALEAIYGEGFVQGDPAAGALSFTLPEAAAQPSLRLIVHLPASYPSRHAPVFEVASDMLSPDVLGGLAAELEGLFLPGEVCLWTWIEHLRERWAELAPQQQPAAAAAAGADADVDAALAAELQAAELLDGGEDGAGQRQRQRGAAPPADEELQRAMEEVAATVVHGEPITERRSTFQVRRRGACCRHRPGEPALPAVCCMHACQRTLLPRPCRRTWHPPPARSMRRRWWSCCCRTGRFGRPRTLPSWRFE